MASHKATTFFNIAASRPVSGAVTTKPRSEAARLMTRFLHKILFSHIKPDSRHGAGRVPGPALMQVDSRFHCAVQPTLSCSRPFCRPQSTCCWKAVQHPSFLSTAACFLSAPKSRWSPVVVGRDKRQAEPEDRASAFMSHFSVFDLPATLLKDS